MLQLMLMSAGMLIYLKQKLRVFLSIIFYNIHITFLLIKIWGGGDKSLGL
jgi:hypothetical protein